jgi:hypothetical protein
LTIQGFEMKACGAASMGIYTCNEQLILPCKSISHMHISNSIWCLVFMESLFVILEWGEALAFWA